MSDFMEWLVGEKHADHDQSSHGRRGGAGAGENFAADLKSSKSLVKQVDSQISRLHSIARRGGPAAKAVTPALRTAQGHLVKAASELKSIVPKMKDVNTGDVFRDYTNAISNITKLYDRMYDKIDSLKGVTSGTTASPSQANTHLRNALAALDVKI